MSTLESNGINLAKSHVAPHFNHLGPKECNGAIDNSVATTCCQHQHQRCHMTKIQPHVNCLDLNNAVVALKMLSETCDASADTYYITWSKESCCTQFQSSWPKESNGAIDEAVEIMWHLCQHHIVLMLASIVSHDKKGHLHPSLFVLT